MGDITGLGFGTGKGISGHGIIQPDPLYTIGPATQDMQKPLDPEKAEHNRKKSLAAAREKFMGQAEWAIRYLAARREFLTSETVWSLLDEFNIYCPNEPSIMGGAFKRAFGRGIIMPTEEYKKAVAKHRHGRPIRVWRSLIKGLGGA